MLKEEKELRRCVRQTNLIDDKHGDAINRMNSRLITALVRAVREDCANMVEWDRCGIEPEDNPRDRVVRMGIAMAIRGRK